MNERALRTNVLGGAFGDDVRTARLVPLCFYLESGEMLQVIAEVLRIERHPGHPLAALQLLGETDEWRGLVWEPAAPRVTPPPPPETEGDAGPEEDDEVAH